MRVEFTKNVNGYEDPERDQAKVIIVKSGLTTVYVQQKGPHGFWSLSRDSGTLPFRLRDAQWTNLRDAQKAAEAYIASLGEDVKPSEEGVPAPIRKPKGYK